MTQLNITELDFAAIKEQLKSYLTTQTKFKDYDFEGSNMSVMLDVLAYNTYQNNFYTNMAINEMFLDSAVLQNSIISHAKELNYLPRSRKSAKAVVDVTVIDTTLVGQTVTIPQYAEFTAQYLGNTYRFVTDKSYVARKIDVSTYKAEDVEIYEGTQLTSFEREGYFIDDDGVLRVILTNENADTDSIEVFIDAEATDDANVFVRKNSILGVEPLDKVFYVEPYYDGRYSVYFGKNVFGMQPTEIEDVRVKYRLTSGAEGNGIKSFTYSATEDGQTTVTTKQAAAGGADAESLESIRFNAPKSVQIQERAITEKDYENILKQRFPDIIAVSAYGGEKLVPPQYGKVAVSVYLGQETEILSNTLQTTYIDYLSDKTPLAVEPIFIPAEFLYADLTVDVFYDNSITRNSTAQFETLVREAIATYNSTYLNEFNKTLRLSNLTSSIDAKDKAIVSTTIKANPFIEYSPELNVKLNPTFQFGAKLVKPYPFKNENGFIDYKPSVTSGQYDINNVCVFLQDDGKGKIRIVTADTANPQIINPDVGRVDYDTGEVKLTNFKVEAYVGSAIKIKAVTENDDIKAPNGRIFAIRDDDVAVNIIETKS